MKKILFFLMPVWTACAVCGNTVSETVCESKVVSTVLPENFHPVTKKLFRSGQPETEEFIALYKSHGLRSVLNLRQYHSDRWKIAAANAFVPVRLHLYEIPLNTGRITERDLIRILTVIRDAPKPLLIHCWHGSDRTGCAVAAYRIVFENWSVEEAITELMKPEYGHHKNIYTNIPALLRKSDWIRIKAAVCARRK